jgi:hypothetical protein
MSNTAKVFQEMRDADQLRADMKQSILDRAKEKLGNLYEKGQDFARESGLQGALNDCYRRIFENGWFQKDIFDGRFQSDTQQLGTAYDQRAAFYQLDTQERGRDRGDDLER